MHTSVGGGTRDFQQSLWSQDDTFHLASLLLTLGRSRNCSCSWRKPRRRRTSFKNKYVLTAAMLWGRTMKTVIHSLSCSLNFSHMANELRTTPAETHTHTPLPMLVHAHRCPHSEPHQTFRAGFLPLRSGSKEQGWSVQDRTTVPCETALEAMVSPELPKFPTT